MAFTMKVMGGTELGLGLQEVADLVCRMQGLDEAQAPALLARIKQMQRLGFLKDQQVGTGSRVSIDAYGLLRISMAFELISAGIATFRAVELLNDYEGECRLALMRAWQNRKSRSAKPEIIAVIPHNLALAGKSGHQSDLRRKESLVVIPLMALGGLMKDRGVARAVIIWPGQVLGKCQSVLAATRTADHFETALA